jgi:hypothetical protein
MFYGRDVPVTPYYIKNKAELDEKFREMPLAQRQLIQRIDGRGNVIMYEPDSKSSRNIMSVLDAVFKMDGFEAIEAYDQRLLRTHEYKCHLPDFTDLSFDPRLSCKKVKYDNYEQEFSRIYYADFETDVITNPACHKPYLCCVISKLETGQIEKFAITENFANNLLACLEHNSLCYFHNLKYDACQFMNDVTEFDPPTPIIRNGKIMKLKFVQRDSEGKIVKRVTFVDSYSIIPARLKNFAGMFKLDVHKEFMPYKLYTLAMIEKNVIPLEDFLTAFEGKKREKIPEIMKSVR